ncbi:DUF3310 domain-containing protein [Flavobacteriaceae bacterium Ap0902]|nr:DUF3310 domain-containing protein [Flavobacteriaceae bacterium Ap0902]
MKKYEEGYPELKENPIEEINKVLDEKVNHPSHYGGKDNPYEAIKVIEAHNLNFCLGNVIKYTLRAGKKENALEDLKKAKWYLEREIKNLEKCAKK